MKVDPVDLPGLPASRNPLSRVLPPEMSRAELARWLEQGPVAGRPSPSLVRAWLEGVFVATATSLEVARSVLMMMRYAADMQNPRSLENRLRAIQVRELIEGKASFRGLAPSASALCITGITGVGKSHTLKHVLSRIPQVVEHDEDAASHMLHLRQLVHLTIELSGDGTPFAFFTAALARMDEILGTTYLQEGLKLRSGARGLLVFFMQKVVLHRVLFIAIEEAQERNLDFGRYTKDFQSVFLQLLNFCIPIALVGNPKGIAPLLKNAQVRRRLTSAGLFMLEPAMSPEEPLWADDYMDGIWGISPLEAADEVWCSATELSADLWKKSGGFAAHLVYLRCESIREAMDRGSPRVESVDLEAAYASSLYAGQRLLADIFASRDARRLEHSFKEDIDAAHYSRVWRELALEGSGSARKADPSPEVSSTSVMSEAPEKAVDARKRDAKSSTRVGGKVKDPGQQYAPNDTRSDEWLNKLPEGLDSLPVSP